MLFLFLTVFCTEIVSVEERRALDAIGGLPSGSFCVVANGSCVDHKLLRKHSQNATIVALDGASSFLNRHNIKYHVLLGNFDAVDSATVTSTFDDIDETSAPYVKNGLLIVPAKDQMLTDLKKGILFCRRHAAAKIEVFRAFGDREDHCEWNRNILKNTTNTNVPSYCTAKDSVYHISPFKILLIR